MTVLLSEVISMIIDIDSTQKLKETIVFPSPFIKYSEEIKYHSSTSTKANKQLNWKFLASYVPIL